MRTLPIAARTTLVAALAFTGIPAMLSAQQTTATESDVQALREQIQQLDQKLRVLERNQELQDEAATDAAKKLPTVTASDKGFALTSSDKSFSLKLGALVQFDSRFFLDDGAPNRDGFFLRRIRTPFSGTIDGIYDFNITPELGANALNTTSSTVGLIDAWFDARFSSAFGLKAGRFASPVGLEPGANRHFIESPFVNTLLPNRDIGLEAFGTVADGFVDYRLGVYSGTRNNTQSFSTDSTDGDKTIAGRLTFTPFKKVEGALSKLSLGIGASHGNEKGTTASNDLQNIVTNGQQTLLNWGTLYANGEHTRISPSIEWYPGNPWSFVAEYAWEKQDLSNGGAFNKSITNTAWRATVGYVLTGEESTKSGVVPASPFNLSKGGWGAFEVVARVSGIDLDDDLFNPTASGGAGLSRTTNATGAFAYGLGLNWYFNRNVVLLFNVEKTDFDGGGAGSGGVVSDELYVFSRFQLKF